MFVDRHAICVRDSAAVLRVDARSRFNKSVMPIRNDSTRENFFSDSQMMSDGASIATSFFE